MNVWSVAAMGIGAMVGAGIFALLGVVAIDAGDATWLAFLIGGIIATLSGYSYAKLAQRYPDAGGVVAFFKEAFGARLSGTLSLLYLLTVSATIAMVAKAFGGYAAPLAFGGSNVHWVNAFASGITIVLLVLNVRGSKLVGKAELWLVGIKLAILALLIGAGTYGLESHGAVTHAAPRAFSVVGSVCVTLLAYAGYSLMPNAAGNVANPKKTIPRAIYLAIGVVTLLYVALAVVVVGTVPVAEMVKDAGTAAAEAARPVLGHAGYVLVSVAALLATASCINAWDFTTMQVSLAMAHDGQLPPMFGHVVWGKGSLGLILGFGVILLAINVFDLTALAGISGATFVICHMAVQVAHWRRVTETRGSRVVIGIALTCMTVVLASFLWSLAHKQPWAVASVAGCVAASAGLEEWLGRGGKPGRAASA
jgi:amino acid transporter